MSKHKIYIGKSSINKVRLGDSRSTDYSYDADEKILRIYWRGEEIARQTDVIAGDAFIVTCDGSQPVLNKMHFPKHPSDFLMYILGFGNGMRCHDWDSYYDAIDAQRKVKLIKGREVYEFTDQKKYLFCVCEDNKERVFHLGAIVVEELTADDCIEILTEWPYPIRYPKTFLREELARRFGIDKRRIDKIFKQWDKD